MLSIAVLIVIVLSVVLPEAQMVKNGATTFSPVAVSRIDFFATLSRNNFNHNDD
jgi:hypothetical protein